jgi:hypothetical protein
MSYRHPYRFLSIHDGFSSYDDYSNCKNESRQRSNDDDDDDDQQPLASDEKPVVRHFRKFIEIDVHFPLALKPQQEHEPEQEPVQLLPHFLDLTIDYSQRAVGIHLNSIMYIYPYERRTTFLELLRYICALPPFLTTDVITFKLENALTDVNVNHLRMGFNFVHLEIHDMPIGFRGALHRRLPFSKL